jgi:hypothetical protein
MPYQTKELNPEHLVGWIEHSFSRQKMFTAADFMNAAKKDEEAYFPLLISKTLKQPNKFTLFGIVVDELHIKLDTTGKVVAVFIVLDNQNLLDKMVENIGNEYMAAGVSVGDTSTPYNYFLWDFKGGCVTLNLNAYKIQFKQKIVRDNGLIIFNNCNPLSYILVPRNSGEID